MLYGTRTAEPSGKEHCLPVAVRSAIRRNPARLGNSLKKVSLVWTPARCDAMRCSGRKANERSILKQVCTLVRFASSTQCPADRRCGQRISVRRTLNIRVAALRWCLACNRAVRSGRHERQAQALSLLNLSVVVGYTRRVEGLHPHEPNGAGSRKLHSDKC